MTVRSITIACILSCVGCDGWYQVRGRLKTPAGDSIPAANIEVYQGNSCNVAAELRSRGTSLPDGTYSIGFVDSPFGDQVMAVHSRSKGSPKAAPWCQWRANFVSPPYRSAASSMNN